MANPWGFLGLPEIQEFLVVGFVLWGREPTWRQASLAASGQRDLRQFEFSDSPNSMDSSLCESFSAHQFSGESAARDFKVSILKGIFNLIFQAFGSFAEIPNLM